MHTNRLVASSLSVHGTTLRLEPTTCTSHGRSSEPSLLHHTMPKLGIEVTFIDDPDDLDAWRGAVRDNTKLFFGEVLANPRNNFLDIENIADVAHEHGVTSSPYFSLYENGRVVSEGYAFPDENGGGMEDFLDGYVD